MKTPMTGKFNALALVLIASTTSILMLGTLAAAHPAFALQHFFNCVTDISNKDGGDHNLTLQQVIDCFKKEFPNNPGTSHFEGSSSITTSIDNGHVHSEILN